ncbi:MAG: hypothetical protein OXC57_04760 [Rhodobacteraceae bacterium]|nr:hypothetical protein [Paracoccaceae bacterium]
MISICSTTCHALLCDESQTLKPVGGFGRFKDHVQDLQLVGIQVVHDQDSLSVGEAEIRQVEIFTLRYCQ